MAAKKDEPHYPGVVLDTLDEKTKASDTSYPVTDYYFPSQYPPDKGHKYPPQQDAYYDVIATLGDDPVGLTCSMHAARKWGRAKHISPFSTFEEAAEAVKEGMASAMLVPAAYPAIRCFITDPGLKARETFIQNIPSIVLVGLTPNMPSKVDTLYHHPATDQLLPDVAIAFTERVYVTSNTQACVKLLTHIGLAAAITNRLCADYYKLPIYTVLRESVAMPWIVFGKN